MNMLTLTKGPKLPGTQSCNKIHDNKDAEVSYLKITFPPFPCTLFLLIFSIFRASLVPVFAFGENDLFNQVSNPRGSRLRDIQLKIQKKVAFAPVLFHGRGIFQYTFGLLPHRKPVNVVGKSKINETNVRKEAKSHYVLELNRKNI